MLGSIAQSVACLTAYPDPGVATESKLSHINCVEIDYEIISVDILSLPLIQEGYSKTCVREPPLRVTFNSG